MSSWIKNPMAIILLIAYPGTMQLCKMSQPKIQKAKIKEEGSMFLAQFLQVERLFLLKKLQPVNRLDFLKPL